MTIPRNLSQKECSTSFRCTQDHAAFAKKHTPRPFTSSNRPSCPQQNADTRHLACYSWRDSREDSSYRTGAESVRPVSGATSITPENRPDRVPRSSVAKRKAATTRAATSNGSAVRSNGVTAQGAVVATPAVHFVSESTANSYVESETARVSTEFVAETLLPTTSGKYRLRGYRHTLYKVSFYLSETCGIRCLLQCHGRIIPWHVSSRTLDVTVGPQNHLRSMHE